MTEVPGETSQHVFFSYSRKDGETVHRLNDALKAAGRKTWVDLEGIPLSAEWLAEINKAIDGAQACVFVLSPDWVSSDICLAELRHAVDNNKRLIPMLHRELSEKAPEDLAQLNWLFCREEDDFDATVAALIETIDMDLDHVRVHTRLLVRANEWESRLRESSRLLRGKDLREAGEWLETSAGKEPAPNELHEEYVSESRKTATRRRRMFLGGLAAASILALVGSAFGVLKTQKNASIAVARQGQALVSSRPADGLVYAIQAVGATRLEATLVRALRKVGFKKARPTFAPEVRSSLFAGVHALQLGAAESDVFDAPGAGPVQAVVFSGDGKTIVSGSDNGTVQIWDMKGDLVGEPFQATKQAGWQVFGVDVSADGETIVSGGLDYAARVWQRGPDGEWAQQSAVGADHIVRSVAFSPVDDGLVAIGNNSGRVFVWQWKEGVRIASKGGHAGGELSTVTFSPNGQTIVSTTSPATPVRLWDLEGNEVQASWYLRDGSEAPRSMTAAMSAVFSPDGETLAIGGGPDGIVRFWTRSGEDQNSWELAAEARGHEAQVTSVAFVADGRSIVTGSTDGTVRHWDLEGHALRIPLRGHEQGVAAVAVAPDGRMAVSAGWSGNLRLWRLTADQPGRVVGRHGRAGTAEASSFDPSVYQKVNAVAISADGERIVSGGHDAFVRVWDRQGHLLGESPRSEVEVPNSYQGGMRVMSVAISADGKSVVAGGWGQGVIRWDSPDGVLDQGRQLRQVSGQVRTVGISADGRIVASGSQITQEELTGTQVWRDGKRIEIPEMENADQSYVAVSADGDTIVRSLLKNDPGPIEVWHAPWQAPVVLKESELGVRVNAVAVSAGGETVASADQAAFVQIWSGDGTPLAAPLTGHRSSVYSVAVSPDGQTIVSGGGDATLRLWDRQGNPIGEPLRGHESLVSSLGFSADGQTIVSGSWDGTVRLWPFGDLNRWLDEACEWVSSYDGTAQMTDQVMAAREVCASRATP